MKEERNTAICRWCGVEVESPKGYMDALRRHANTEHPEVTKSLRKQGLWEVPVPQDYIAATRYDATSANGDASSQPDPLADEENKPRARRGIYAPRGLGRADTAEWLRENNLSPDMVEEEE